MNGRPGRRRDLADPLPEATLAALADDFFAWMLWRDTDGYFDVYATGPLDPSGYVKGWAAEVASRRLVAAGSTNHFINAGGDVRVRGCPAPGERWHIPVRHPWQRDGAYLAVANAYATAGVAMGMAGLPWLAALDGYEMAVATEDGQGFRSPGLPEVPAPAPTPAPRAADVDAGVLSPDGRRWPGPAAAS